MLILRILINYYNDFLRWLMLDIFILNLFKVHLSRQRILFHHKHLKREVYSVIYLWFSIGVIICQIRKTNRGLSAWVCELCPIFDAGWRLFTGDVHALSYMRQIDGYLQRVYSACHLRQDGGCLQGVYALCYLGHDGDCLQGYVNPVSYLRQVDGGLHGYVNSVN
jgi:hypothetical protein